MRPSTIAWRTEGGGGPIRDPSFDSNTYGERLNKHTRCAMPSPTLRTSLRAFPPALRDENFRPWRREPKQRIAEMLKSGKSRAEEQFAAIQKKDKQALKEKEKARQESAEHVARLRALRLAKEAADKKAAEKAAAEKAAAKTKKPSRSPQARRRQS